MPSIQDITDELSSAPIEDLAPVLTMLADRLHKHRMENGGRTPRSLWKSVVEIGPSYACIELVLKLKDPNGKNIGVMLKQREQGDQGWQGLATIPGVSLMPTETLMDAAHRLVSEYTDDAELRDKLIWAIFITKTPYVEVHREDTDSRVEGRRVNCMTAVFVASIESREMMRLKDDFVIVTPCVFNPELASNSNSTMRSEQIVDHHRTTLTAIWD